ncbi:MAG: putative ABC transporter permease [Oscillospiraceae bacterium]|nr:putative ABC transporter permease [Oscillospiraceae bacterium]
MSPINTSEALARTHSSMFARCHLCKILWYFVIGAVFGCIFETTLTLLRTGQLSRRVGLMYGPFNTIYGVGAVVLYLALGWQQASARWSRVAAVFLAGAIVCSVLEYTASLLQEKAFGTKSWDYSNQPLNINGRVCLLSFAVWGGLSVAWVWWVQPFFERLILLIPIRVGIPLTAAMFVLMLLDVGITVAAVIRWGERVEAIPNASDWARWLDAHYPDSVMRSTFPNMRFLN